MNNIDKILEKAFILFCLLVLINLTIQHIYAASSVNTSVSVSDHTHQDAYGNATLNDPTNRLVVTSTTPAINLTIASTTTNPTIDYSALITGGTGTIGAMTLTANNAYGVIIAIPQSVITNTNTSWDGIMNAPTPTTLTLPTVSGENRTLSEAIEFGLPDVGLTFSRAIKITFPNQGGKRIGYIRTGINFTDINTACNSANDQAIMDAQFTGSIADCKITSGNDLIIWTKHFTKFATFSSTSTSSGDSPLAPLTSNTTSNPVCNDSKPVSAPVLLPAKPGKNSVTLTWEKAKDPVTHYVIAYGTTSEAMEYGNPYAGGRDTTTSEIKSLTGGATYYFKVKAINNCMPGDFSNVVSSAPLGVVIESTSTPVIAEGFVPIAEIARYLFDISLSLQNSLLNKSSDLVAQVKFSNFGNVPTVVSTIYTITDSSGKEVFRQSESVSVETERVVTKEFKSFVVGSGKYILVLSTLYGDNVKDEFRQVFEVKEPTQVSTKKISPWVWVISIMIISLIGYVISRHYIKRKHI